MTSPPSEMLERMYGLKVDHNDHAVLLYDLVTGTTAGLSPEAANALLDELRYHVAQLNFLTIPGES